MAILQYNVDFPGQDIQPRLAHMLTDDTLAKVQTAGYINPYIKSLGIVVLPTDFIIVAARDGRLYGYYTKVGTTFTIVPFATASTDEFALEIEH